MASNGDYPAIHGTRGMGIKHNGFLSAVGQVIEKNICLLTIHFPV
jgi:hypothetical protein